MAKQTDAITALVYQVMEYLKAQIPELEQVLSEFPEPNQELKMPCVSVLAGQPTYVTMDPYQLSMGPVSNARATVKTVIGMFDTTLQLDLWAGSKAERGWLRERVIQVLNPRALEGISGLGLRLSRYHDTWANLTVGDLRIDDSEASSQRAEWRSTIDLLANCRAVAVGEVPVITQTDTELQVAESRIDESDVDFETE